MTTVTGMVEVLKQISLETLSGGEWHASATAEGQRRSRKSTTSAEHN